MLLGAGALEGGGHEEAASQWAPQRPALPLPCHGEQPADPALSPGPQPLSTEAHAKPALGEALPQPQGSPATSASPHTSSGGTDVHRGPA